MSSNTNPIEERLVVDEIIEQQREYTGFDAMRKIPNAVDGMKISGRRILYGMEEMGARSKSSKLKSARITGDVAGKLHPHGTSSIYGVMVTMAQEGASRYSFIEGQGGWGSVEREAASERYTKCRLNPLADAMLGGMPGTNHSDFEIYQGTVPMIPSYSGEMVEPTILPSLIPAFVVNGGSGLASGISSNMPSHNLSETMDLALYMVDHKRINGEKVREFITGPDVASDCMIYDELDKDGKSQIESYFETGRGSFRMVARHRVEEAPGQERKRKKEQQIIIYGLPLGSKPSMVVAGIKSLALRGSIPSDVTVVDASSAKNGTRILVRCGLHNPQEIWDTLLFYGGQAKSESDDTLGKVITTTSLNYKFSVYMAAIDKRPRSISVIEAMNLWIEHRRSCIRKRSKFKLDKIDRQIAVLDAQIAAAPVAKEIVETLMNIGSTKREDQVEALVGKFPLDAEQAGVVLDMTIARIVSLDVNKLTGDRQKLEPEQETYLDLVTNDNSVTKVLRSEIKAVKKAFGDERMSEIMEGQFDIKKPEIAKPEEPVVNGYLMFTKGRKAARWITKKTANLAMNSTMGRFIEISPADSSMYLEAITDDGMHLRGPKVNTVPDKASSSATFFAQVIGNSAITSLYTVNLEKENSDILMVTEAGKIKRTKGENMAKHRRSRPSPIVTLDADDKVAFSAILDQSTEDAFVVALTSGGNALRIPVSHFEGKGEKARASNFIKLSKGDKLVYVGIHAGTDIITWWTERDTVGKFTVDQLDAANPGTMGKKYTQTKHRIAGAIAGEEVNYQAKEDSEPESFISNVEPDIKLGDRNISRSVALGLTKSVNVW